MVVNVGLDELVPRVTDEGSEPGDLGEPVRANRTDRHVFPTLVAEYCVHTIPRRSRRGVGERSGARAKELAPRGQGSGWRYRLLVWWYGLVMSREERALATRYGLSPARAARAKANLRWHVHAGRLTAAALRAPWYQRLLG